MQLHDALSGDTRRGRTCLFFCDSRLRPLAAQVATSYIRETKRREHARSFNSAMESHPPRLGPLRRLHVAGVDTPRRKVWAPDLHFISRLRGTGVRGNLDGAYPARALVGGQVPVHEEAMDTAALDTSRIQSAR